VKILVVTDNRISILKESSVKYKGVYLAIIASLLLHALVLTVLNFIAVGGSESVEMNSDKEAMINLDFVELDDLVSLEQGQAEEREDVSSLVADANSEYVSERVSHHSEKEMEEQVYEDLKELEKQFFEEAQSKHTDEEVTDFEGEVTDTKDLDKYDYLGKSFEGAVSATFDLIGRDAVSRPLPTYKCKTSGTVTINITVNQRGEVQSADINPSRTSTLNECLLTEARVYAKRWKFDNSFSHPKKQEGSIVFKFQAQ